MKPKTAIFPLLPFTIFFGSAMVSEAQWNGSGLSSGNGGLDIANSANWQGGLINGNFTLIDTVGEHNLVLSSGLSFTSGLNFDTVVNSNTVSYTTLVGGSGYTGTPGVTISGGTGTGANGTATRSGSAISAITISSHGSGYYNTGDLPAISLSGGGGTGAGRDLQGTLPSGSTHIMIDSDVAGQKRVISLGGTLTPQDRSDSRLTFGSDVDIDLTSSLTFANSGGLLNAATIITFMGDVTSSGAGAQNITKNLAGSVTFEGNLNLDGSYSSSSGTTNFNGLVSGLTSVTSSSGGSLNFNHGANTFGGNITIGSGTTVNSVTFANAGQASGIGAGNQITLNGTLALAAAGEGVQATNRNIVTANNGSGTIRNNSTGTAALHFIGGTYTAAGTGNLRFGGSNNSSVNIFGHNIGGTGTRSLVIGGDSGDTAVWRLTGNNTGLTGSITISRGVMEFGSAASLGTGANLIMSGSGSTTLRFVGRENTVVGRNITFGNTSTSNYSTTLTNNGQGTLTFKGEFTAADSNASKTLQLLGFNLGENTIQSNILRGTDSASSSTGIVKNGSGTWVLSGANTIGAGASGGAGSVTVNNGRLVLDYSTNDVLSLASNITLGGGTLEIRGKSGAGNTTEETLGNVATTADTGFSRIIVNNNGGDGTTLNLGNFTRNNGTATLLDLSLGGKITTTQGLTSQGLLSSGTPHWFVRTDNTATGVDYATKNGSNEIVSLGATTNLPSSGGSTNTNYRLSGSHALTGDVSGSTLRVDTTGGGTLDLGSFSVTTPSGSLFVGDGDYTVDGTGYIGTSGGTTVLNYFGTGKLNLNVNLASGTGTVFLLNGGSGLLNWTSASNTTSGHQFLGGVIRVAEDSFNHTNATTGNGRGEVRISTGAILELQADFTRDLGTGNGHVDFKNEGGFSAFGGDRTVTLEGGAAITWAGNFVTDSFLLGSDYSDSTLIFTNNLNLTTQTRVFDVRKGVNDKVDGRLTGVIDSTGGGLVKRGDGKLELTNANTYSGETWVEGGELVVNNTSGSGTGSSEVRLSASTTLSGYGTIAGTVSGSGTIAPGGSPGILTVGSVNASEGLSFLFEMTALSPNYGEPSASGNDVLRMTSSTPFSVALNTGNTITIDFSGLTLTAGDIIFGGFYADIDFSSSIEGATLNYIGLNGLTANMSVSRRDAGFQSGLANGYVTRFEIIPEPSSFLAAGLGGIGLMLRRRRTC